MSVGHGIRLTFIEPIRQIQLLEMYDPPVVPNVGDMTESPDGRLWRIIQRAYIPPMASSMLTLKPAIAQMLELRCVVAQINEDGTFVDAQYYQNTGGEEDAE